MNYVDIQIIKTIDDLLSYQKMVELYTRKKSMPNIKITVKVDGKQVPLETISTETFEAIKALEKLKKIPAARIGNYKGELNNRRLFLKITNHIKKNVNAGFDVIAINLQTGFINNIWRKEREVDNLKIYENIRPL